MKQVWSIALLFACSTLAGTSLSAQHTRKCGLDEVMKQAANNPVVAQAIQRSRDKTLAVSESARHANDNIPQQKTTADIRIPVVFHVILTQAQIDQIKGTDGIFRRVGQQLDALNRDFNAKNPDLVNVPAVFQPLIGNLNVSFALAHTDPGGKSTAGIEIKVANASQDRFPVFPYGKERTVAEGGLAPWDEKKYLNIWIVNLNAGSSNDILGIAYSPEYANALNTPSGVTINYGAFGQNIGADPGHFISNIDSGRTMVHELGHFFGLDHIWGEDSGCGNDDGIDDTPLQADENFDCPTFPQPNCTNTPGGEMFMNYMDYVEDKCMMLFTKQQVTRMQKEFVNNSSINSYGLTQHPELTDWPTSVVSVEAMNEVNVMPNPTNGRFSVVIGREKLKEIAILNSVGTVVRALPATNATYAYSISLDDMPKGLYIMQCRFEERTVTRKIILQ